MSQPDSSQDIDLALLGRAFRNNLLRILALSLGLATLAWLYSHSQAPVYVATSDVIATGQQNSNGLFNLSTPTAPPLPNGALGRVLKSSVIITPLISAIETTVSIPAAQKVALQKALVTELRRKDLQTIGLQSDVNPLGAGIYTVSARASSASTAATLANITANVLLDWDKDRSLQDLKSSRERFQAQAAQVSGQLQDPDIIATQRQTLREQQGTIQQSLIQIGILEASVKGVLSLLSTAVPPLEPIEPRPLRTAALAGLLGFLLASLFTAIRTLTDRAIHTEDDLAVFQLPTLAVLPALPTKEINRLGIVEEAKKAGLYEAIGFLRVNVATAFQNIERPTIMISSVAPGEGKSSVTAMLAAGFASSGRQVLIIDADLRRGSQMAIWQKYWHGKPHPQWQQLTGSGGVRTTREALEKPEHVQVLQVDTNISLLPAGLGVTNSLGLLQQIELRHILRTWGAAYDVILLDTGPLLALADGFILGACADGVLIVVDAKMTQTHLVKRLLSRATGSGLNILGFVLNKSLHRETYGYYSAYSVSEQA